MLEYYFPDAKADKIDGVILASNLHSVSFVAGLLGINDVDRPCFIRNVFDHERKEMVYKVFYLPNYDRVLLDQSVSFYLSVISHAYYVPGVKNNPNSV